MELEKRLVCHDKQELRVEEVDGKPRISGLAVPYSQTSEDLGGFREMFSPGAFADTLTGTRDVFGDVEHDSGKKLARRSKQTLELSDSPEGLRFAMSLPDTTLGRDTAQEVREGLLDGVSIEFSGAKSKWIGKGADTIRQVSSAALRAITLTAYPAYRQTVGTVAMRSLEEHRKAEEEEKPPEADNEVLHKLLDSAV